MADCDEVLRDLYTFLDGELAPGVKRAIAAHLDGCHDCLEVFDFHAELRAVISRKCRDEVPETLVIRIQNCFGME